MPAVAGVAVAGAAAWPASVALRAPPLPEDEGGWECPADWCWPALCWPPQPRRPSPAARRFWEEPLRLETTASSWRLAAPPSFHGPPLAALSAAAAMAPLARSGAQVHWTIPATKHARSPSDAPGRPARPAETRRATTRTSAAACAAQGNSTNGSAAALGRPIPSAAAQGAAPKTPLSQPDLVTSRGLRVACGLCSQWKVLLQENLGLVREIRTAAPNSPSSAPLTGGM